MVSDRLTLDRADDLSRFRVVSSGLIVTPDILTQFKVRNLGAELHRFEDGLVDWADLAICLLESDISGWDDSTAAYIYQLTTSRNGRWVDPAKIRDEVIKFIEDDVDLSQSENSLAQLPRLQQTWPFKGNQTLAEFLNEWSPRLWQRIAELVARRQHRSVHFGPDVSNEAALTRSEYVERERLKDAERATSLAPAHQAVPASQAPSEADAVIDQGTVYRMADILQHAAGCVLRGQPSSLLGHRFKKVTQEGLQRRDTFANAGSQRLRIFLVARAVVVATERGDISFRASESGRKARQAPPSDSRTLVTAIVAIAREVLLEFEKSRTPSMESVYQESRRATGQVLYLLEQGFEADGNTAAATAFRNMLDLYQSNPTNFDPPERTHDE